MNKPNQGGGLLGGMIPRQTPTSMYGHMFNTPPNYGPHTSPGFAPGNPASFGNMLRGLFQQAPQPQMGQPQMGQPQMGMAQPQQGGQQYNPQQLMFLQHLMSMMRPNGV